MKSIGNPVRFPDMQEQLVKGFTNIRVRCDALLAQRISELSKQNAELLLQMKSQSPFPLPFLTPPTDTP